MYYIALRKDGGGWRIIKREREETKAHSSYESVQLADDDAKALMKRERGENFLLQSHGPHMRRDTECICHTIRPKPD